MKKLWRNQISEKYSRGLRKWGSIRNFQLSWMKFFILPILNLNFLLAQKLSSTFKHLTYILEKDYMKKLSWIIWKQSNLQNLNHPLLNSTILYTWLKYFNLLERTLFHFHTITKPNVFLFLFRTIGCFDFDWGIGEISSLHWNGSCLVSYVGVWICLKMFLEGKKHVWTQSSYWISRKCNFTK